MNADVGVLSDDSWQ